MQKKFNVRKRTSRHRKLGERCIMSRDCASNAVCIANFCSCPEDYYVYMPIPDVELTVCRMKIKHGFRCSLTQDCSEQDSNSECFEGVCQCIRGTYYHRTKVLFSFVKRCYNISLSEGDVCEIHDQCFGLEDAHHKCRCIDGRCTCVNISGISGCLLCKENITVTVMFAVGIFVLLLTGCVAYTLQTRANRSRYDPRNLLNTVPTAPPLQNATTNLRGSRDVASSLPNVFSIEARRMVSSHDVHGVYTQTRSSSTSALRSEDLPPSYEEIIGGIWNDPPPSYQEISAKIS